MIGEITRTWWLGQSRQEATQSLRAHLPADMARKQREQNMEPGGDLSALSGQTIKHSPSDQQKCIKAWYV